VVADIGFHGYSIAVVNQGIFLGGCDGSQHKGMCQLKWARAAPNGHKSNL
jgi:hypothetical protein